MASPAGGSPVCSALSFLILFFLLASALPNRALSEHAAAGDGAPALRLPSEMDGTGGESICPLSAAPATCPVRCFRTDPVCGADGVTYWCGCAEAACAGARVAKMGFCDVGNGGSGAVTGQVLLLVHMVWLIVLGVFVVFGLF